MAEHIRLSERITPLLETSLKKYLGQEDVMYDVTILPSPSGPVVLLTVIAKSAIIGEHIHITCMIDNPAKVDGAQVEKSMVGLVEQIHTIRSKALASGNGEGVHPKPPGINLPGAPFQPPIRRGPMPPGGSMQPPRGG